MVCEHTICWIWIMGPEELRDLIASLHILQAKPPVWGETRRAPPPDPQNSPRGPCACFSLPAFAHWQLPGWELREGFSPGAMTVPGISLGEPKSSPRGHTSIPSKAPGACPSSYPVKLKLLDMLTFVPSQLLEKTDGYRTITSALWQEWAWGWGRDDPLAKYKCLILGLWINKEDTYVTCTVMLNAHTFLFPQPLFCRCSQPESTYWHKTNLSCFKYCNRQEKIMLSYIIFYKWVRSV